MSYHYKFGSTWAERAEKMAEDLADLREHRGFAGLLDLLESEIRARLKVIMDADSDDFQVSKARDVVLALQDTLAVLHGIADKKDLQELQESVMKGFTTDEEVFREHAEALAGSGFNTPNGGGVYE